MWNVYSIFWFWSSGDSRLRNINQLLSIIQDKSAIKGFAMGRSGGGGVINLHQHNETSTV